MSDTSANSPHTVASGMASSSPRSPLRHRAFLLLWITTVVSNIGTWSGPHQAEAFWPLHAPGWAPLEQDLARGIATLRLSAASIF